MHSHESLVISKCVKPVEHTYMFRSMCSVLGYFIFIDVGLTEEVFSNSSAIVSPTEWNSLFCAFDKMDYVLGES